MCLAGHPNRMALAAAGAEGAGAGWALHPLQASRHQESLAAATCGASAKPFRPTAARSRTLLWPPQLRASMQEALPERCTLRDALHLWHRDLACARGHGTSELLPRDALLPDLHFQIGCKAAAAEPMRAVELDRGLEGRIFEAERALESRPCLLFGDLPVELTLQAASALLVSVDHRPAHTLWCGRPVARAETTPPADGGAGAPGQRNSFFLALPLRLLRRQGLGCGRHDRCWEKDVREK
mmetsp:Transcript_94739/g.203503  ORF Transcript_94739/g.203503 Transcript_94739/m.203503 type:complete len:240 (-) Transcript_94739:12-731(-)